MPVHQNLVVGSSEEARAVTRGDLDLAVCGDCGFVFNRAFDPVLLAYGRDYDNTQTCSAYFDAYVDDLVRNLVESRGVRDGCIVEVGCGKGHFLRKLVAAAPGSRGYGFDPSYVGEDTGLEGRLHFRRCFYDDSCVDVQADVVVCRHVIEHVPAPMALLGTVRSALALSPRARVFFETPCVEWILRNRVVWDLFYEHCSLFTAGSLTHAFERAGFAVERVDHVFGGQYLWLEAVVGTDIVPARPSAQAIVREAVSYGADEQAMRGQWRQRLLDLTAQGRVALWGAGAKGATFANLVDPERELIECVVDVNPNKQGRCIPGTGHPIVSVEGLIARGVRFAVLMNPNYREENLGLLAAAGSRIELLDWSSP